jgi:hypothetical protein
MCLATFVEARGVLWDVKSEIDRDQHDGGRVEAEFELTING